jgi:50S ribosomal protein L16 3-hydroxylase
MRNRSPAPSEPPIEVCAGRGRLLGMAPTRFLRHYWQKRPLLIRRARPGFVDPLPAADLAALACTPEVFARLVTHQRRGDRYRVRFGPFAPEEFTALPERDWTLLVQDVDKWVPKVGALLADFDFLPRWRLDDIMISYAVPGGSVGPHVDQYDVFLLQGSGRRRWQIDASARPDLRLREHAEIKLLRVFRPSHDWLLEPGDMLYLPPGVPHHGVAVESCTTLSIGLRAPSAGELLLGLIGEWAEGLPDGWRYADPGLKPARAVGEIDAAALRRVAELLRVALPSLEPADLADWFGRFITRYRALELGEPVRRRRAASVAQRLTAGAVLRPDRRARWAWHRSADGLRLYVAGLSLPIRAPDLAVALCAGVGVDLATWRRAGAADRALIEALYRRGLLVGSGRARHD